MCWKAAQTWILRHLLATRFKSIKFSDNVMTDSLMFSQRFVCLMLTEIKMLSVGMLPLMPLKAQIRTQFCIRCWNFKHGITRNTSLTSGEKKKACRPDFSCRLHKDPVSAVHVIRGRSSLLPDCWKWGNQTIVVSFVWMSYGHLRITCTPCARSIASARTFLTPSEARAHRTTACVRLSLSVQTLQDTLKRTTTVRSVFITSLAVAVRAFRELQDTPVMQPTQKPAEPVWIKPPFGCKWLRLNQNLYRTNN